MIAVNVEVLSKATDGHRIVRAFIISDDAPVTLPTSGKDVGRMKEDDEFAPFSVLYVVGDAEKKLYIANESGEFVAQ